MQEMELNDTLNKLIINFGASRLKIDLEAEIYTEQEIIAFKNIGEKIPLVIKIGGCEARHDMSIAKKIGTKSIVAPMIESKYALSKYIKAVKEIFNDDLPDIYINIETITAYENIETILDEDNVRYLSGIVIGRSDLTESFGLEKADVNSEQIFDIVKNIVEFVKKYDLECIIGGNICPKSVEFLQKINEKGINGFETRKVVFSSDCLNNNPEQAILEALKFERLWIEYKINVLGDNSLQNIKRLGEIKQRQFFE